MSDATHFRRVAELFDQARGLPADQREGFIRRTSDDDAAVADEVMRLLRRHDDLGGLDEPPIDEDRFNRLAAAAAEDVGRLPERIGRYRVRRTLGEGGMGAVYLAEQDKPRRDVAVKVIRRGLVSRELLKRFEFEAAVLGRLQHPAIAQIYEAGMFDDGSGGQPFFAMEYVKGSPLLEWAQSDEVNLRARLETFMRVCDAVHHAHQRGVIHRDLKPGNILVDSTERPKILDFGVARATDSDLQVTTLQTDVGQLIGTLPYMSPEQVTGRSRDIDVRSDVYALGVILYELLADRLPYDLRDVTLVTAARIISSDEPAPLSTINRVYRGDLNTIVLKALEKDPDRRYQSASDLAADIVRYLHDEPIVARPATTLYQLRKYAQRHTGLVAGLAVAFVILVAGAIVATVFAIKATRAGNDAIQRATDLGRVAAFQDAQLSRINPREMGLFLRDNLTLQLRTASPVAAEGAVTELSNTLASLNFTEATLGALESHLFQPSIEAVESEFGDQPLIKARLLQTLSDTMQNFRLLDSAAPIQREALDIRRRLLGADDPATLASIESMGHLHLYSGRFNDAQALYLEAIEGRRRTGGGEHPDTLNTLLNLGVAYRSQGKMEEAERCVGEALESARRSLGSEHPTTLTALDNLGHLAAAREDWDSAVPLCIEALEGRRKTLGNDHEETVTSMNNVGVLLANQQRYDEAEPYLTEALQWRRDHFGDDHPSTLSSLNGLAGLALRRGRVTEAVPYFEEALAGRKRAHGDDHPNLVVPLNNLAYAYFLLDELPEAEELYREAVRVSTRALGDDHPDTLWSMDNLAEVLTARGTFAEAEALLLGVFETWHRLRGEDARETVGAARLLIGLYETWHEAEPDAGYDEKAVQWQARFDESGGAATETDAAD